VGVISRLDASVHSGCIPSSNVVLHDKCAKSGYNNVYETVLWLENMTLNAQTF